MRAVCAIVALTSAKLLLADLPQKDGSFYSSKGDACSACKETALPFKQGGSDAWHQYCVCYAANAAALATSTVGATDKDDWVWACSVNTGTVGANYKECFTNEEGKLYQNKFGDNEAPESLK
mmetsp:Transcript_25036/g.60729  ORF Transcript_25036/g.60729 Transcript_25036/m.60729 type:complete len:122 (+) Transcript_25036:59-424(+)